MRNKFDEQLALLNKMMIEMGALCETFISLVSNALLEGDIAKAKEVAKRGHEIDQMEKDIETICLKLLLSQQPVARDLRQISAALKMITDMERIGDQAEDIAEIVVFLNGRSCKEYPDISHMAHGVIKMVTDSVNAYVKQDLELAKSVSTYDDIIDDCFSKIKTSLIETIANNPEDGEFALDILMIAKYFERIGDHAVNIGEWVEFSLTGIHKGE